ncbi:hypothetical protein WA538_001643 [Blastocystis sp. DL]
MNSHFLSAVAPYMKQEVLTHQQQVCRLYKHSLMALLSWSTDREIFMEKATALRKRFRDAASLDPNSEEAKTLLEEGIKEYAKMAHPDRYVQSWYPGGATYMRNAPPPMNVVYPHGVPKEVEESVVPIHPDGTPYNWRPNNDPILVDFLGKKIYGF